MKQELRHARVESENILAVNWVLYNVCNYTCTYCSPYLNSGDHKGIDSLIILRFIHNLTKQLGNRRAYFEFTGGEVTFHPEIDQILSFIKKRNGLTGIITNAARPVEWWNQRLNLFDHVCASFHAERGDQDHFSEVIGLLNVRTTVHVNIMMLPERFDELYAFGKRLLHSHPGISLSLQPLFENFHGEIFGYTPEQRQILADPQLKYVAAPRGFMVRGSMKKITEEESEIVDPTLLISRQENRWKGWNCFAGVENLLITMDGHISRGICHAGGALGNIKNKKFGLNSEPIICPYDSCKCAFDIMSTKTRT